MGKIGGMLAGLTALMGLSAAKTVQDAVNAGTYVAPVISASKNTTTNAATKANRVQKRRAKAKKARVSRRKNRQ